MRFGKDCVRRLPLTLTVLLALAACKEPANPGAERATAEAEAPAANAEAPTAKAEAPVAKEEAPAAKSGVQAAETPSPKTQPAATDQATADKAANGGAAIGGGTAIGNPTVVESAAPARPRIESIHLNDSAAARGQVAAVESPLAPMVQVGLELLPDNEGMALKWALPYMVSFGFLTQAQADRMEKVLGFEYGAMAKIPEFAGLESTLKVSAQSLFATLPVVLPDHSFVLLPDKMDPARAYPLMLFLHGQGMNFKAYAWAFWKNAGHNDWIILMPTIEGWRARGSEWTAYYTQLVEWARATYKTDGAPITVVGHSAGAFDALRLALHHPTLVGNVALLAGHWREGVSDQFDALWPSLAKHNILVHCAEKDTLVPLQACKELHRQITVRGNPARFAIGPEMDHFSVLEGDSGLHRFLFQWLSTR